MQDSLNVTQAFLSQNLTRRPVGSEVLRHGRQSAIYQFLASNPYPLQSLQKQLGNNPEMKFEYYLLPGQHNVMIMVRLKGF